MPPTRKTTVYRPEESREREGLSVPDLEAALEDIKSMHAGRDVQLSVTVGFRGQIKTLTAVSR